MKNFLFSITLIMCMSSFVKEQNNHLNSASQELAQQLIQSLQQSSPEAYTIASIIE